MTPEGYSWATTLVVGVDYPYILPCLKPFVEPSKDFSVCILVVCYTVKVRVHMSDLLIQVYRYIFMHVFTSVVVISDIGFHLYLVYR